MSGQSYKQEG